MLLIQLNRNEQKRIYLQPPLRQYETQAADTGRLWCSDSDILGADPQLDDGNPIVAPARFVLERPALAIADDDTCGECGHADYRCVCRPPKNTPPTPQGV